MRLLYTRQVTGSPKYHQIIAHSLQTQGHEALNMPKGAAVTRTALLSCQQKRINRARCSKSTAPCTISIRVTPSFQHYLPFNNLRRTSTILFIKHVAFMARFPLIQDVASKQRRTVVVDELPRQLRTSKQG